MISASTLALIQDELKANGGDVFKVSRKVGIPVRLIREHLPSELQDDVDLPRVELYGGWGRPELKRYLIARYNLNSTWGSRTWASEDAEKIKEARAKYDAGLIEMAQGRDGDWILLYAIPRKNPEKNRMPYFSRSFD